MKKIIKFSPESYQKLEKSLGEASSLLSEMGVALTALQRCRVQKLGSGNSKMAKRACAAVSNDPSLAPSYVSVEGFRTNFETTELVEPLLQMARSIEQTLMDIQLAAGNEVVRDANDCKKNIERAAANGVHGAKAVSKRLKEAKRPYKKHADKVKTEAA
jgi:hypothetical protein